MASDLPPLTTSDTRASSISAIPMHEVEPSPVDVDDDDPNALLPAPATAPSSSSSSKLWSFSSTTNFLGLTPSRMLHILSATQKYSTLPPTIYLAMHYANTALIPLATRSAIQSDRYLLLTRPYYQSFPLEPLLIFAPIITHVLSGVALRLYRRRLTAKRHGAETHAQRKTIRYAPLSTTSAAGYALYPMFVAHVAMQRVVPNKVEGSSAGVGLRFFAHGVAQDPWFANTFYAVFVAVASWHFVTGAAKYLRLSREYVTEGGESGAVRRKWRTRIVNGVAAAVASLWIAGGLGVVGRAGPGVGWEAKNWDRIYAAVPLLGRLFR
ncbi:hypothetical protein PV08_04358 [Exophiala spinifera]|uniref:Mitochondrial adapter protein MCP1 transmembrane domain-containing protein n=1 Tax=Exophiala spinifera TaxID=91928 RepID=A0A0D1ZWV0_9EURO|nr:uncharacterized protein PV08_04358 [Exophiala spinifera]KIW17167.1 hypothetical protein PV08_04358 [Exophiala spinifera]